MIKVFPLFCLVRDNPFCLKECKAIQQDTELLMKLIFLVHLARPLCDRHLKKYRFLCAARKINLKKLLDSSVRNSVKSTEPISFKLGIMHLQTILHFVELILYWCGLVHLNNLLKGLNELLRIFLWSFVRF
jgi:hypothetical protein